MILILGFENREILWVILFYLPALVCRWQSKVEIPSHFVSLSKWFTQKAKLYFCASQIVFVCLSKWFSEKAELYICAPQIVFLCLSNCIFVSLKLYFCASLKMIHWKGRIVFSSRQSLEILKGTVGRKGSGILVLQIYSCFTLFTFSSFSRLAVWLKRDDLDRPNFTSQHKFVFHFNPTFCLWVPFQVHFRNCSCRMRNRRNLQS